MSELFYMGGPLFMSMLTLLLILMVSWIIYQFFYYYGADEEKQQIALRKLKYGRSIGLFALIMGILGQLIGFYSAFSAIEEMGNVSPAMMFGGIKVSMITTIYGILIYLLSLLLWFLSSLIIERKVPS